jgi:aminoglycoside phosphotransferase
MSQPGAELQPEVMAHGYTHRTTRLGSVVTKDYQGPDAAARCRRESAALTALAGRLPVPPVLSAGPSSLCTGLLPGVHGQDLIAAGLAGPVLSAGGDMLRRIHALPIPAVIAAEAGATVSAKTVSAGSASAEMASAGTVSAAGTVLVHGDYGPNNVLLDASATEVPVDA